MATITHVYTGQGYNGYDEKFTCRNIRDAMKHAHEGIENIKKYKVVRRIPETVELYTKIGMKIYQFEFVLDTDNSLYISSIVLS